MLLALLWAGVPAWQHAHPAGDRPHSHHDDWHHDSRHHGHGHHGQEREHHGAGESHAHVHVTLLGIGFTLPAPDNDSEEESEQGHPTYLVTAPIASVAGASLWHLVWCAQPLPELGQISPSTGTFRPQTVGAAPLCDTARHERSGVQLI
jgi:hypothetical protein